MKRPLRRREQVRKTLLIFRQMMLLHVANTYAILTGQYRLDEDAIVGSSLTPFIVLFTLVWDFFNQVSWRNAKHPGELAQGDGGGRIEGVRVDAFNRLVGDICLSVQFAHTDAFFPGNLFDS
jgi:hypothetical protein